MASIREELGERVKQRIAACQAEVRELLYGEAGCPVWGTETRSLVTEAGPIEYQTPKAYLPKSRRAFFPSGDGAGDGDR